MSTLSSASHDGRAGDAGRLVSLLFIGAFFLLVLVPFVCMPFANEDVSAEKRELAPEPRVIVDGRPNLAVLKELGDYFADHFAFRGALVDLDATVKQRVFMTSATSNVVVGTDGWLYYAGTLNDYQCRNTMSDHELKNITTNLALIQEYVLSQGKGFVLAVAPNKNTLYADHMPYYEVAGSGQSNVERLLPLLVERGVFTTDLAQVFRSQGKTLYYARDSHWNEEGALLVYRSLLPFLTTPLMSFADEQWVPAGHVGDVDAMLHPRSAQEEADVRLAASQSYAFENETTSVEQDTIETSSKAEGAAGTLMMYRDSFGNNLLPYYASAYAHAHFSKLVPYDMGSQAFMAANDVIIERAERHVDLFATSPPYMQSPLRSIAVEGEPRSGNTSVRLLKNGPYLVIEGTLDETCATEDDAVFVQLEDVDGTVRTIEAFHVSQPAEGVQDSEDTKDSKKASQTIEGDWGYRAFMKLDERGITAFGGVRILVGSVDQAFEVKRATI